MTKGNDAGSPVRLRTLREIERVALLHMDPVITEFLQGGSGAELTLERNRSDFDRIRFVPRVMSGCPYPSTSTTVAGIDLRIPVMTAPFGAEGYFHPDGHLAVARANERFGVVSVVPEAGTYSAEQVAEASPKAAAFGQLHPMGSEQNFRSMVQRYVDAGYRGLVLTLDCPTPGWREHNLLNDFNIDNRVVGGNYPPGAEIDMERALGQLLRADGDHLELGQAAWAARRLPASLAGEGDRDRPRRRRGPRGGRRRGGRLQPRRPPARRRPVEHRGPRTRGVRRRRTWGGPA